MNDIIILAIWGNSVLKSLPLPSPSKTSTSPSPPYQYHHIQIRSKAGQARMAWVKYGRAYLWWMQVKYKYKHKYKYKYKYNWRHHIKQLHWNHYFFCWIIYYVFSFTDIFFTECPKPMYWERWIRQVEFCLLITVLLFYYLSNCKYEYLLVFITC